MKEGLKEAIKLINEELEYAKEINPIMALGMVQIRDIITERLKKEL